MPYSDGEQLNGGSLAAENLVSTGITELRTHAERWAGSAESAFASLEVMLRELNRAGSSVYTFGVNAGAGFESPVMPPATLDGDLSYSPPNEIEPYQGEESVEISETLGDVPSTTISIANARTPSFNVGNAPQEMRDVHAPNFPSASDYRLDNIHDNFSDISDPKSYNAPRAINPLSYTVGSPTHHIPDGYTPGTYTISSPDAVSYSKDFSTSIANHYQPFLPDLSGVPQLVWTWTDVRGNSPDWTRPELVTSLPTPVDDLSVTAPGAAPQLETITLSTYSGPSDPIKPTLITITPTPVRDVVLPDFTIAFSSAEIPTLSVSLDYTDPGYLDSQIAELKTEISRVLNGDLGIPAALWDALWDKASTQIIRQGVARERQARLAWSKLGWSMPGGVALAQAEQAWQDINEQTSEKARELAIQRATMMREDFWNAVQHGVACQKMLIDLYNAQEERKLKAAVSLVEALVNVYNANVSKYTADLQRVQALVAIKELELKGALATLDVDKAKLEGDKLRVELNKLNSEVYVAEWEGVKAAVSRYASMVEADKTKLEAQRVRLELYSEEVKAYVAQVDAWAKQWEGYTSQLEGQKLLVETYDTNIKAFSERVKAYSVDIDYEKERAANSLAIVQTQLEADKNNIESFKAQWGAIQIQLDEYLREYDTKSRMYAAQVELAKAQTSIGVESDRLQLESRQLDVKIYEADWQGITTKATVWGQTLAADTERYKADVQGHIAEIEADGRKIDAEARRIDAEARIYTAQWEAEAARVRALASSAEGLAVEYRAEADAARLKTEADIKVYEAQIKGQEAALRGVELEQQGAIATMQAEAETAKLAIHAYTAKADIEAKRIDAAGHAIQVNIARYNADVERYKADAQAAAAEVSAKAQIAQAKSSVAEANARIEQARVAAVAQNIEVATKQAELDQRGMIEAAQLAVQQALANAQVQVSGLQSLGQMYSQLVAGAYSAANVSAQIGASYAASESDQWHVNHNYSYDGNE